MDQAKYIGMDVHQATISVAVMDSAGKLILESILETKAATILQLLGGLRGSLLVTFEEGTSAAWLYDLLKPHVAKIEPLSRAQVACRNRTRSGGSLLSARGRSEINSMGRTRVAIARCAARRLPHLLVVHSEVTLSHICIRLFARA
jgi:hypothetical protein